MKRITSMFVCLMMVAACVAGAVESAGPDAAPKHKKGRKGRRRKSRLRTPKPLVASCLLLSRLGLSEEQLAKAKPLDEELAKKFEEFKKEAGEDKKKQIEFNRKLWGLFGAARKKIVEQLNAEQKKKHAAGVKVLQAFNAKLAPLKQELEEARREAGKNRKKHKELWAAFKDKTKPFLAERDKQLDEQVGKRPERKHPDKKKPEEKQPPRKEEKKDPAPPDDDFDF